MAPPKPTRFRPSGIDIALAIAAAKLVVHCVFNSRYGHFRDEFDYLACGAHPAFGYVDQPPLVPLLAQISRLLLGDSTRAIRFLPALAASAAVVLGALLAREWGGRRFAVVLTAVAIAIAPIYLSDGSLLTTNSFEPLLWMGCAWFVVRAIRRDDPRCWLWFGVVAGIGLEEKYSIAIFCLAILAALLLTPERRLLASRWLLAGGAVAFLIFLPNLLWNFAYHWPFLELMRNIRAEGRDVVLSPVAFFAQQVLLLHPLAAPVWIAGLGALLFWGKLRPYRALGWCYLIAFAIFLEQHGKNYYLAPIYPMLLAAGAVAIEHGIENTRQRWLKPATLALLAAGGAWLAPIVVPVLPIDGFLAYAKTLPFAIPRSEHSHFGAALPQHYADQFGWREIVAAAAQAWYRIPPAERGDCGIFAQDYGQAGAIDFFGPRSGLPPALSGHQTWWIWGPRGYSGQCLVVLGDRPERLRALFDRVEFVTRSAPNPYALERDVPVYLCRGAKFGSLAAIWPELKKWR